MDKEERNYVQFHFYIFLSLFKKQEQKQNNLKNYANFAGSQSTYFVACDFHTNIESLDLCKRYNRFEDIYPKQLQVNTFVPNRSHF